jgi:hypothetical protein
LPTPYIPTRFLRNDADQPQPHCNATQVFGKLLGNSLNQFRDLDGSLTSLTAELTNNVIPEISGYVVSALRTPLDWCRRIWFAQGTGGDTIVLPNRFIAYVNVVFIRVLPSMPWYRFSTFRNVDGTEFERAGFVEPPETPAFQAPYNLNGDGTSVPEYTGIEDADILVDTNSRSITIPPRALILTANAAVPFSSYSFIRGALNVEIHYTFGFAPTKYLSGAPLQFDGTTGAVIPSNPTPPSPLPLGVLSDTIDWSSGMPSALTNGVARIVANRLLRQAWRGESSGLSSITVDGGSESYGSKAYGGDLDDEEEGLLTKSLPDFGINMVI